MPSVRRIGRSDAYIIGLGKWSVSLSDGGVITGSGFSSGSYTRFESKIGGDEASIIEDFMGTQGLPQMCKWRISLSLDITVA